MARNKFTPVVQKFYLHYNKKTGNITSVSNEMPLNDDAVFEVTEDEYIEFMTGEKKPTEYIIGYAKDLSGKTKLTAMPKTDQVYGFRSNVFEWITEPPTKKTELVVTWDNNQWIFKVSEQGKLRLQNGVSATKTVFFVMLENDFDFLIRSIILEVNDLIENEQVVVPFISNIEKQHEKISISSKVFFQSYGLIINE